MSHNIKKKRKWQTSHDEIKKRKCPMSHDRKHRKWKVIASTMRVSGECN